MVKCIKNIIRKYTTQLFFKNLTKNMIEINFKMSNIYMFKYQ